MKKALGALLLLALALTATACSKDVNTEADSVACIYDGSDNSGHRLKGPMVQPSSHRTTDSADDVVKLPSSLRFYSVSANRTIADPGAERFYTGNAQGGVKLHVQGQIRFRFNRQGNTPCDWYSLHGKRNEPLGFNSRALEGWGKWLNENPGVTMQQTIQGVTNRYDWAALVFDFPVNAGPDGIVPKGQRPGRLAQDVYADDVARAFTERLAANIGGDFFCGPGVDEPCPPVTFQVFKITTEDPKLTDEREQVVAVQQELENAQREADLRNQQRKNQAILLRSARLQVQLARLHATAAILGAMADKDNAKCIAFGRAGLSCDGSRPSVAFGAAGK